VGDPAVVDGPAGYGQALTFTPDGGDDYVDLGTWDPSEGTGQLTVSLWLNWDGISGQWMGLIGKRDNWAAGEMMWHIEAAQGDGSISVSREGIGGTGGYGVPVVGEWEHCAFTFDGTTCTLYRDGEAVGSNAFSFGSGTEAAMQFGSCQAGGNNPWNGALDEVRLYNDALTDLEVRYLADAGPKIIPEVPDEYVPPIFGPLALHMEFEGDYVMGPGREATPVGDISFEDDPIMGSVLSLPGGSNQFVDCGGVGISGNDPTTIACWAKADHTNIPNWTLIFGFTGTESGGGGSGSHFNIGSIGGPEGIGAHVWGWEERILSDEEGLDWHHYAMTYDGSRIEYYADGVHKDTEPESAKSNNRDLSIRADRVHIGSRITQDSSFPGKVDDCRIYNYTLSLNEIMTLAGVGDVYIPPVYSPLLAAYDFEGNANDSSGNGNDGTLMGGATIVDGVLNLGGSVDDYVDVPHADSLTVDDEVTVMAWIKAERHNAAGGNWQAILAKGNSPRSYSFYTYTNGTLHFSTAGTGTNSSTTVPLNEWVHVAAQVKDGAHQYYINGERAGGGGSGISLPGSSDTASVRIGRTQEGGNNGFLGQIDDVHIFDTALTAHQVAALARFVPDILITDVWSAWGFADIAGGEGVMDVATGGVPGLPYYIGEVGREVEDLSLGGAAAASIWFHGDGANTAEHMYAALSDDDDSAIVLYDGDPADLANEDWQEWNIDLSGIAATEIAIGLAGLDGSGAGDLMTFDDLRTHPPRCLPDRTGLIADINGDCRVDLADLQVLVDWWDYVPGAAGVAYEYYPEPPWIFGNDVHNAPYDTTTPAKSGTVNNFDIGIREQNDRFGFRFKGMITVPTDGDYTFYTSSDDGSMLDIGDTRVVQNYGWHGMQWREGTINLTAGAHPIMVAMFEDGGGEGLEVEYAGPGIDRQAIPDDVLTTPPLPSEVDLYVDGVLDWNDVFALLDEWLLEVLWP
jgi:hypothetical protein